MAYNLFPSAGLAGQRRPDMVPQMPSSFGGGMAGLGGRSFGGIGGLSPGAQGPQVQNTPPGFPTHGSPWPTGTPPNWMPKSNDFRLAQWQMFLPFLQAGYFDPRGNPLLIEQGRQRAAGISGSLQRRTNTAISAAGRGLDPAQAASYRLQSMIGSQGMESQLLNQALMDAYNRQADFAQQLALSQIGFGREGQEQQQSPSPWGGILSAVGAGLGGLVGGPPGAAAGGMLGGAAGGGGGGPRMGQPGFQYPYYGR